MPRKARISQWAHDLREPLLTILLWEQVARLRDDPAIRDQALDAIGKAAREQQSVIDRMVKRARASARVR
jgi:signal transduction histidine kinase